MANKRSSSQVESEISDQDPDYAMVTSSHPAKKQKLHQQDAKDVTTKKIEGIIKKHFAIEIKNKEKEIDLADERIHQVQMMLDKLRACVVANFYGNAGIYPSSEKPKHKMDLNHPAVQRALGTGFEGPAITQPQDEQHDLFAIEKQKNDEIVSGQSSEEAKMGDRVTQLTSSMGQGSRFHVKKRIIVGNVSKYISTDNREESDPSTHKWMVYVRGPSEEPRIDHFVQKVWFFLHPSYRPNDLVEVKDPPFHLTRRGWGEFPIRVQLHFYDSRSKKVDIIHQLKLDRTYTGLQTLGAETIVDVELDRYMFDEGESSVSRPSTPTVTKVNYREGFKAGLSRTPPSLRSSPSIVSGKSSSPQTSDDQRSTPASSPISELSRGNSRRGTPVALEENFGVASRSSTPSPSLTNKVQIQSGMIVSPSGTSPDQSQGKFIQVMPTSVETTTTSTVTKSSKSLLELPKLSLTTNIAPGIKRESKIGLSWKIEEGKLLEVNQGKKVASPKAVPSKILTTPLHGTASGSVVKPRTTLPSLKAIGTSSSSKSAGPSQMTLLGRQTVKSLLGSQKGASAGTGGLHLVSNTPGAQYYITAKSTDPNLQGKVILIPHQVFAQASAQQPGGGKTVAPAKTTAKATTGKGKSFLSPSNVLILPQGSIVPPLPPGSIVQIQQVPSPGRTSQSKSMATTSLTVTAGPQAGITSVKTTIPSSGKKPVTKIIQSGLKTQAGGVSLLSDIKTQLARTPAGAPSGGVILVQRMPTQPKPANTQVGPGIQKITVSQAQKPLPSVSCQAQTKLSQGQTIILQSPSTSPTKITAKGLQVVTTTQGQNSKHVLTVTESAQTLPVSEGTVEITRTLKEAVTNITPTRGEVIVTKTRAPSNTSFARLPGLSPIKPVSVSSASNILIKKEMNQDVKRLEQQAIHVKKLIVQPESDKCETKDSRKAMKSTVQLLTLKEKGGPEKITIKSEPIDDVVGIGPSPGSTALSGPPQDGVLKLTTDARVKQDTMSPSSSSSNITRLADPTSRVIITKLTSPIPVNSRPPTSDTKKAKTLTSEPISPPLILETQLSKETTSTHLARLQKPISAIVKPSTTSATIDQPLAINAGPRVNNVGPIGPNAKSVGPSDIRVVALKAQYPTANVTTKPRPSSLPFRGHTAHVGHVKQEPTLQIRQIKQEPVGPETIHPSTSEVPRTYLDHPELLRYCAKLNMKVIDGVSLYEVKTMEQLVRNIVRVRPLFDADRKVEELPYSASCLEEFQSWLFGKRRAVEWLRALDVRRTAYRLIHKVMALWNEKIWSTKQIMIWCRQQGYTPHDISLSVDKMKVCELCGMSYSTPSTDNHDCQTKWLTDIGILRNPTYSIPDDWCQKIKDLQKSKEKAEDDDILLIDVVNPSPRSRPKPPRVVKEEIETEPRILIPLSPGAELVTDIAHKIGINFKCCEVDERIFAPVVEEMIFAATKRFLSDVLHLTHAKTFEAQTSTCSRIPTEIKPAQVYQAIQSSNLTDFLTNDKIGVLNEIPGSENT